MNAIAFWAVWAAGPDFSNRILKFLAVAGGAAVGAVLAGLLARLATRMLTTRPMAPWAVRVVRVVGAVAAGYLVYLYVTGPGGSGVGGPGGGKVGEGKDSRRAEKTPEKDAKKKAEKPPVGQPVRVEILGARALRVLKQPPGGPYRGYRLEGDEERRLYDFAGITDYLRGRLEKDKSLRVVLVIYKDSPDRDLPVVSELADWLTERKVKWEPAEPPEFSPEVRGEQSSS